MIHNECKTKYLHMKYTTEHETKSRYSRVPHLKKVCPKVHRHPLLRPVYMLALATAYSRLNTEHWSGCLIA